MTASDMPPPKNVGQGPAAAANAAGKAATVAKVAELSEGLFVENDRNRDPFRAFSLVEQPRRVERAANQREVLLSQFNVDELKLVAIVSASDGPRAMLVDPSRKGWVVRRGSYIGRSEVVHTGGQHGADYQVNWRIDRIRADDLVLVREDPANPTLAPSIRVMPLYSDADKDKERVE